MRRLAALAAETAGGVPGLLADQSPAARWPEPAGAVAIDALMGAPRSHPGAKTPIGSHNQRDS